MPEPTPTPPTPEPTPAPTDDLGKKYSEEAAAWRVKFRSAEQTIAEQNEALAAMESRLAKIEGGNDKGGKVSEVEQRLRDLETRNSELEKQLTKERETARSKMLGTGLRSVLTDAKVVDVDSAVDLLKARGARLTDDDRLAIDWKDKDGDKVLVDLTPENIRKYGVLGDHFFPAESRSGSGSTAPKGTASTGLDLERASKDPAYYIANRDAIRAHLREQERGSGSR